MAEDLRMALLELLRKDELEEDVDFLEKVCARGVDPTVVRILFSTQPCWKPRGPPDDRDRLTPWNR